MSAPAARRRSKPRAVPKPTRSAKKPTTSRARARKPINYQVLGLAVAAFGLILLLATRLHYAYAGTLRLGVEWLFGSYGAWGVAAAIIVLGVYMMFDVRRLGRASATPGMTIVFLAVISLLQFILGERWNPQDFANQPGGAVGSLIAEGLYRVTGELGVVVLIAIMLLGVALLIQQPVWVIVAAPFKGLYAAGRWVINPLIEVHRQRQQEERTLKVHELQQEELHERRRLFNFGAEKVEPTPVPPKKAGKTEFEAPKPKEVKMPPAPVAPAAPVVGVPSKENPAQLAFDSALSEATPPTPTRPFELPPTTLLTLSPKSSTQGKDDSKEKVARLEETLSSFGIDAKVVGIEKGPRVTRFEVVPPPGIRINRITNLADNLALSLAALDVRVEAPVPGKGVVGIEVPNQDLVMVDLREIAESEACKKSKSPLTFTLGRDIAGHPRVADLTKMPHLLIAGATNSGKSVCINSLICSILLRATPQQVKFLMVDPKRVELILFQHIPHLIAPVAHDAKHAAGLLRWAIREMEQRYEMFAEKGVRNITGFNEQSRLENLEELPYICIIIDELADLMMQAAAEFEASICRIAQLARATGIHLVVATQRPSVNVITGTIKANIPSRIAFAVASQVDSRTILDMNGAERLVGQGDMLYLPVDASKPMRIQGAYVSEADINRVVEFVKKQDKPHFTDEIVAIEEEALHGDEEGGFSDEPEDELFDKALDYIRATKYASTSMLQRKFRIGYTRAARMMDLFEERGYVGPGQGSKPREVIFAPPSSVVGRPHVVEDEGEERDPFEHEDDE